ncbi:3-phosphoshikimate 1-carboxyvinyltransferase [Nesterenkonia sedimenti]|uniref:3-phosphoshikimate 1-carboxyvinyltransferase n=1 Tax=Nesterenkonia sedimenti TaxID=1463632 RepID=UPI002D21A7D8|nr:3-phosphoshikimate 1-carboxyvinyltransferase [Nesterenkonia sedimenti]
MAAAPVCGDVSVPASKSLTNRYLLLAALADDAGRGTPSTVINPLQSRDSQLMLAALERLGAGIEHLKVAGEPAVRITPISLGGGTSSPTAETAAEPVAVDCGLAGTVMRFLPAVAALTGRRVFFDGDATAYHRPMGAVLEGLRGLGVQITEEGEPGFLPFTIHPHEQGLTGDEVTIDASASSQFVSGLLLAAARFPRGLTLHHSGSQVPSLEHVEMTLKVLRDLGVEVDSPTPYSWRVQPGVIEPFTVRVEPDLSNAGPFLCAAAVTGGEVSMPGWPLSSTQIGRRWPELLRDFGCDVKLEPTSDSTGTLYVRGPQRLSSPGVVDGTAELTPTVAALAALCPEETKFTSVQHLRGHETDRLAALVAEIRRLGGQAEETDDGFRVLSPVRHGAEVFSYADHRMATFGAILGLVIPEVSVEDIGSTSKTMPDFPQRWKELVAP